MFTALCQIPIYVFFFNTNHSLAVQCIQFNTLLLANLILDVLF